MFLYHILMTSLLWLVLILSLYKEDYLQIFNVCPFDYTALAVSGKVWYPLTGLTTPIAWISSVTSAIYRPKSVPQLLYNRLCIYIINI